MEIKNIVSLQDQVLKATFLSISHIYKYLKVLKHIILKSEKSHEEEWVRKVLHTRCATDCGPQNVLQIWTCLQIRAFLHGSSHILTFVP